MPIPEPKRPDIPAEEQLFAELVVEQGLCTRERVDKCIAELRDLSQKGVSPLPRLGDLLSKHGYLHVGASPKPGMLPVGIGRGHRCGSYLLIQKIGEGGMGEVWKARDLRLDRPVALKFLIGRDPAEVERFLREAKLAAELNHPNIAPIFEVGDEGGQHFIAMHLVNGATLKPCARGEERKAVVRIRQAALGVAHAHARGIIHRDIKPANIMVEPDKDGERVYVLDFGLARRETHDSKLTASGIMVGTAAYMPPEQARGAMHEIDARSDVYGLGATLFETLTGSPPFSGNSVYDIVMKVCNDETPSPSSIRKGFDADLETIILKCMEKERDRRYPGAAELAADLERWLNDEPISGRRPTLAYRLRKTLARRRLLVGASALLILVIAAAVSAFYYNDRREELFRHDYSAALEAWQRATLVYRSEAFDQETARGLMTDALSRFERMAAEFPRRPEGPWLAGRALRLLGRTAEAETAWTRALSIAPSFLPARFERGKCRLESSITARVVEVGATRLHFRVARNDSGEAAARRRLGEEDLTAVQSAGGLPGGATRYLEGALALGHEKWTEAAAALGRYAAENRWDAESHGMLALALLQGGRTRDALDPLDRALRLSERADWLRQRALVRHALGDHAAALADCDRIAQLQPPDEDLLLVRSVILGALERHDDAERELTVAIAANAASARLWNRRGVVRLARGDRTGATADIEEAIRLDPADPAAYSNLGTLRVMQGRLAEAIVEFDTSLEIDPTRIDTLVNRASALVLLQRLADAVTDLRRALTLAPGDVDVLYQLAQALDLQGARTEAVSQLRRALADAPASWPRRANAQALLRKWNGE